MSTVVREFYKNQSFCRDSNGNIKLWKLYNLFTGAKKSSYFNSNLDHINNAFNVVKQVRNGLEDKNGCWHLN